LRWRWRGWPTLEPDDGLQVGYRRLAGAILLRAARDLEEGGLYAEGAGRFLVSQGALELARGLGLDVRLLLSYVRDREARVATAVTRLQIPEGFVPLAVACECAGISRSTGISRIRAGAWAGCRGERRHWFARLSDAEAERRERQAIEIPPGWIPLREASTRAGISRPTGRYRIRSGRWRGCKIRGRLYVHAADVEAERAPFQDLPHGPFDDATPPSASVRLER